MYIHVCYFGLYRHWQKLMESTGKNFDMNPETFTLENLFAMELHNFADTISDIVGSANKELNIEKSLNEVVMTWHNQRFSIHKYIGIHTVVFCTARVCMHACTVYLSTAAQNFFTVLCTYVCHD